MKYIDPWTGNERRVNAGVATVAFQQFQKWMSNIAEQKSTAESFAATLEMLPSE
jgi:hypothetical protein